MEEARAYELKLLKKRRMIQDCVMRYREEERKVSLQLAAVRRERMRTPQQVQAAREKEEMDKKEHKADRKKEIDQDVAALATGKEQQRAKRAHSQPPRAIGGSNHQVKELGGHDAMKVERGKQSKTSRAAILPSAGEDAEREIACTYLGQPGKAKEGARTSKDGAAKGTPRLTLMEMLRALALTASPQPKYSAEQQ